MIRWFGLGTLALAPLGCGSSSSTRASSDGPPALNGEYDSATGDRESITFEDATHYSFVWRTCNAGAGVCTEEGTYALNDRRDMLTFTNASTGASTSSPFEVVGVAEPARPDGVAPLDEPAPSKANAPLVSEGVVSGGTSSIVTTISKLIVRFSAKQDMYVRTPLAAMGIRG